MMSSSFVQNLIGMTSARTSPATRNTTGSNLPFIQTLALGISGEDTARKSTAETHHLKKMEQPEAHREFLLQGKAWKRQE
jgi:hypothetical protein